MRPWRKHPDLCILGILVAGVFAFQHGKESLAFAEQRLTEIKQFAVQKFGTPAGLVDTALTDPTSGGEAPERTDVLSTSLGAPVAGSQAELLVDPRLPQVNSSMFGGQVFYHPCPR